MAECLDDLTEDACPSDSESKTPIVINYGESLFRGKPTQVKIEGSSGSNIQIGPNNYMNLSMGQPKPNHRRSVKCKKRLTTSTAEPNKNQLDVVANQIGRDWKRLGLKFDFSVGELDTLRLTYIAEGQYEVSYQMLLKWKSEQYPVTVRQLAEACQSIGRGDLADALH